MANNWYVITGAPSAGKSTIIAELARRGYATLEEQGRKFIDQEMAKGKTLADVRVDSAEFELAWTEFQEAAEARLDPSELTFLDRGRLDTLAYFAYYGWTVPDKIKQLCATANYRKVFLLELLDYDRSYFRVESATTVQAMQAFFGNVYEDAGYEVITIPPASITDRIENVLANL